MMNTPAFKCVVAADAPGEREAEDVRRILEDEPGIRVDVLPYGTAPQAADVDLYVPVLCQESFEQGCVFIEKMLLGDSRAMLVPLGKGLEQQQLDIVLSLGVADFLTTPLSGVELKVRASRLLHLCPQATLPSACDMKLMQSRGLIGRGPNFLKQLALLPRMAGSASSLLLLGETGTGKEVFARAVHYLSARAARPWVAVNCGAIPPDLLESELFGHLRGAFTGAHAPRAGLVREAESGTLFLDEIDSLPYNSQSKLLRFLQDMEYRSVGSDKLCRADVRVIAASNHDLAAAVEQGRFRRDLFYRLNTLTVKIPPLRERVEDIYPLAMHFLGRFAQQAGGKVLGFRPRALQRLYEHTWPGNVRELEHVVERAVLLADDRWIDLPHLDIPTGGGSGEDSLRAAKTRLVNSFERAYIERLLRECEGNIGQAARLAKKNRRALFALIRKHGIAPQHYRPGADSLH